MFETLAHKVMLWIEDRSVRYYMKRMHVGRRVSIKRGLYVSKPENVTLGDDVRINANLVLLAQAAIRIGDRTMIAPNVTIVTANHDVSARGLEAFDAIRAEPVTIGRDCWLGAGVIVLAGVTVGDEAVVGAGSLVTGDLPPATICYGAPARPVRPRPAKEG